MTSLSNASTLFDAAQELAPLAGGGDLQNKRLLKLSFPHDDAPAGARLLANTLNAYECLSRDFCFTVEVLSDKPDIELKDMLGKMVTVELVRHDGTLRHFNGYVFDFRFLRNDAGFTFYDMVLLPWLAFLRYRKDNYLFHGKSVEQQTGLVFAGYDMRDWEVRALGPDAPMTDACQFDESDYNYVHRRWEAKGWLYWYEHRADGHTLVLSGDSTLGEPIDGDDPTVSWQGRSGVKAHGLHSFAAIRTLTSTAYTASSFDFKTARSTAASLPTLNKQGRVPEMEVYEYAGAYGFKDSDAGKDFVRLRLQELEAAAKHFKGGGDDARVQAGRWFTLAGHTDPLAAEDGDDNDFLVQEVHHDVSNNYLQEAGQAAQYVAKELICQRRKIAWRPGRGFNSIEPRIYGLQTAVVVGPAGEEIYTDEYGRVRVQFHWDREGTFDEKSSAWIRVATPWAGSHFGMVAIPRIGQEVIVQFLDGNPDRPLITGSAYNNQNMPPWPLPDSKTQTGILTRSTSQGSHDNANAIRFEDRKGQEELWMHAERNLRLEAEHDESHTVGGDRHKQVKGNETTGIGKSLTETVGGSHGETVKGNFTVTSTNGNVEINAAAGSLTLAAAQQIVFAVGKSKIIMNADGHITISGPQRIDLNG